MIEKKTVVSQITLEENGITLIQCSLQLVDGETILVARYHRTSVEPHIAPQAQMDEVNNHLTSMSEVPVAQSDIDRIVAVCAADSVRQAARAALGLPPDVVL